MPGWRELAQEVLQQERQVPAPLAQRRDLDVEDVEAVVEVLAEPALRDALAQVAVRRRDDAHVDAGHRRVGAERLDRPLLQDAQELGLRGQRDLGDLVEEQRAAVGRLEAPVAPLAPRR